MKTKTLLRIHRVMRFTNLLARLLLPFNAFVALYSFCVFIFLLVYGDLESDTLFWFLSYVLNITFLGWGIQDSGKRWKETDKTFREVVRIHEKNVRNQQFKELA